MTSLTRNSLSFSVLLTCFCVFVGALLCQTSIGDEPTNKQKQAVRRIKSEIDKAGRFYQSMKYEASAKAIIDAQERMQELTKDSSPELLALVLPEYERLAKAHELLIEAKQELPELMAIPDSASAADTVSFKTNVAPIIVARCGRCHVNRNRGNFSAASYNSLGASTMVSPGMADQSRMIEVIVDGEMPPGGSLQDDEVATLKNWIAQGAKFDGDDPAQNLNQLTGTANQPRRNQNQPVVAKPTGKETVSFGLHVAPILLESCGQCHIDTNRPQGNFSMASFRNLLRGGDGGSPIEPGSSMESAIIQRMTGMGAEVMPPSGKLDDKVIDVIRTWINEGAKFDGGDDATLPTNAVAARSLADSQSHEELTAARALLSDRNWKLMMSDTSPEIAESKNYRVMGDLEPARLKAISQIAESVGEKLVSTLKAEKPLVKGNTTIFVLERRYDLSELGTMLAKRDLPKEVGGYWDYTIVDAYAAILLSDNREPEEIQVELTQQLAAVYTAGLAPDVPRWFADGVGYWAAAKIFPRDDEVKTWENKAIQYSSAMTRPDDFLTGKLPHHEAAFVGFQFVQQLRSSSGRFKKLMGNLQAGESFEKSFVDAYGQTVDSLFGTPAQPNRRGRN